MAEWLFEHLDHPYPNFIEREEVAQRTGLTHIQIKTWFANARRRKQLHEKRMSRTVKEESEQMKSKIKEETSSRQNLKEKQRRLAACPQQEKEQTGTIISLLQAPPVNPAQESSGLQSLVCMYNKLEAKSSACSFSPKSFTSDGACPVHLVPFVQCPRNQIHCSRCCGVNVLHKTSTHEERNSFNPEKREASVALPTQSNQIAPISNPIFARLDRKPGSRQWRGSCLEPDCIGSGNVTWKPTGHEQFFAKPVFPAPAYQKQMIKPPTDPQTWLHYSSTCTGSPPAALPVQLPIFSEVIPLAVRESTPNFAFSTAVRKPETSRPTLFDAMSVSPVLSSMMNLTATASTCGQTTATNLQMTTKAVSVGLLVDDGGGGSEGGYSDDSAYVDMTICNSQQNESQIEGFPLQSSTPGLLCGESAILETLLILHPSSADHETIENLPRESARLISFETRDSTVQPSQEEQSSGNLDEVAAQLLLNLACQSNDDKQPVKP